MSRYVLRISALFKHWILCKKEPFVTISTKSVDRLEAVILNEYSIRKNCKFNHHKHL